ncbi:MAG: hypothetical protein WD381_07510 [Balneolaceae bacterium]
MFKKLLNLALPLILISAASFAQSHHNAYLKIDYITVETHEHESFRTFIENDMHSLKQDRISDSDILNWQVYEVVYPGSQNSSYNYVSITTSSSLNSFDFEVDDSDYSIRDNFSAPHSEIWKVRNSKYLDENIEPNKYIRMDYMNVALGREYEYQMLEDEIALPLHTERMNRDIMQAWEMYELIIPGGLNYGYNFATGNYFSELQHVEYGFDEELIRSQNSDVDMMQFFENIRSARDLVKSELWRLFHHIETGD